MKRSIALNLLLGCAFALFLQMSAPGASQAAESLALKDAPAPFGLVPVMLDPNPNYNHVLGAHKISELSKLEALSSTFTINFLPAGAGQDGDTCIAWPAAAQTAFLDAASIWASILTSAVPITVDACWVNNFASPNILGHGGPATFYRNFTNAPSAGTWYPVALANALAGTKLNAGGDIYMGYNSAFSWYFGTDGNTPSNQIDFVSVMTHEMAHGLGFLGSMTVSSGTGSWGGGTAYPIAYDRFAVDGSSQQLINTSVYPNPSTALGSVLVSGGVYFNGTNAKTANGGTNVKLYAPSSWAGGSSYSHLDYATYVNTVNALMVYALSYGRAIHDPGPVTTGMLKDMGWNVSSAPPPPVPDFTISAAPTSVSAVQGASGTSTVSTTVTGGFNAEVALTASGLPAGATYGFSPTSITAPGSGSSTLTLTAGAATPIGTYSVTVTGTGGGATHTATISFSVTAAALPNLVPYNPVGWSDKIVVTRTSGGITDDSPLYSTDTLYIDWAVLNDSDVPITTSLIYTLYVDDVARDAWNSSSLDAGYFAYITGYSIGTLSAGTHTIKIVGDSSNVIAESDETDNIYIKTITVTAGAPPTGTSKISATPASVNLGSVNYRVSFGESSAPKFITVKNTGKGDLVVYSVNTIGPAGSAFSQYNDCGTVPPGGSCQVTVTLTADLPYVRKTAILTIASNAPNKPLLSVNLSGLVPPPAISATPAALNFGKLPAGTADSSKSVTVKNNGLSDLVVGSVAVAGTNPGDFTATSSCDRISHGGSCSIIVEFMPLIRGVTRSGNLVISSNDPKKPSVTVKLSGSSK